MFKRMLRRVLAAGWIAASLCCCLTTAAPAFGQLSFAPTSSAPAPSASAPQQLQAVPQAQAIDPAQLQADVSEAIRVGRELEAQRRWSEALTFYEEALRRTPQQQVLEERLHLTRIHYDLAGRYGDNSYVESLRTMGRDKTLELYDEVLLKIQSHYVDPPHWQQLVDSGTAALMEALLDPLFLEANLAGVPQPRVEGFRRFLREKVFGAATQDRQAALNAAAFAAKSGREQLGLNETAVVYEYLCGAANALDPYSTFLSTGKLNEVYSQIEGNFVGLGVELKAHEGRLLIVKVFAGGPADRAGIRGGDLITAVEGRTTDELSTDQAANMLQGQEGTSVEVTVQSPGLQPRRLRVRREQVEVPSVDDVKIVDGAAGIGYLRLTCFQKTTSRDLDAALWKLHREGMKSLIIDLRGNPGGLLNISVDVVDKFVDEGIIVSTRGRNPYEDYNYTAHRPGTWQVPLVVLIDGDSASASEIFAGAIRDHRRGTIVGARSYGKGSVQGIYPLSTINGGIRLTTAKFYSPNGHPFSKVGVSPDVAVAANAAQQTARPTADGQFVQAPAGDAALETAIHTARRQFASR
jgi:carboxyl-terminal processing protease